MARVNQTKPKRVPRAVREQQMLDASIEVFARDGYHGAGMEEIAETAGISKPMVYLYFGSKEELFVACIQREAARLLEMLSRLVVETDPAEEQLANALHGFFSFVADHRGAWTVLYRQARTSGGRPAREAEQMRADTVALITNLLARAAAVDSPGEEAAIAAHALVGAGESLADRMLDQCDPQPETNAKRLMQFAWPGLSNLMEATKARSQPAFGRPGQGHSRNAK